MSIILTVRRESQHPNERLSWGPWTFLEVPQITLFVNMFAPARCRWLIRKTKLNKREINFLCAFRTLDLKDKTGIAWQEFTLVIDCLSSEFLNLAIWFKVYILRRKYFALLINVDLFVTINLRWILSDPLRKSRINRYPDRLPWYFGAFHFEGKMF